LACSSRKTPRSHNEKLPNVPDWDEHTRLTAEKEILGFFISGHPLEKYKDKLARPAGAQHRRNRRDEKSTGKDETIVIAGIIGNVRVLKSKRGDFYAQATLEDMSGSIDMIVFPEAYKRIGDKVKLEVPVLVRRSAH
jgi:DNA polymerase III subunit alpha